MGIVNDVPRRKPMRLPRYDYGRPGYYFVTICTRERGRNTLSSITFPDDAPVGAIINRLSPGVIRTSVQPSPEITLTPWGTAVERAIHEIPVHYPHVTVDLYAIMPDHMHMILGLAVAEERRQAAAPTAGLSTVIQQFKRAVSRAVGESLWQKGYYDHVIRNDEDMQSTRQYIRDNPVKWFLNQESNHSAF